MTRRSPCCARSSAKPADTPISGRSSLPKARRIIAGELARAVAAGEIVLPDVDLAARILCDMACENPMDRLVDPDLPAPGAAAATARITLAIRLFLDGIVQKTD